MITILPYGANSMNDILCRQLKCRCHSNLTLSNIANLFSFSKQFLLPSSMVCRYLYNYTIMV